ncbi:MAG: hypothetical protein B7Y61_19125 [Rhizobiales bacterium 35-66-30]|nr:MAG: hypothetical protein B7Y61_19125 [Rhizobiales bacterium 35-66-30]
MGAVRRRLPDAGRCECRAAADGIGAIEQQCAGSLDAEIDPFPYDPRLEIRSYLQNHLPSLWWANEPEYGLGVFTVTIHIPVNWRGNPTSALQQLCPQANSTIWQGIKRLELQPFYKNAMWPGVVCRP